MGSLVRRKPAPEPMSQPMMAQPMASVATSADVPSMPPAEPAAAVTPADVTYGEVAPPKKRRKTGTVMTSAQGIMGNAPVDRKSLLGS